MVDASIPAQSRKVVDLFRARERRKIEALRQKLGSEMLDKIDVVTRRDVLLQDRDREFADLLGDELPREKRYKVVVTLRTAPPVADILRGGRNKRSRRRLINLRRRSGTQATMRLKATAEEVGAKVKATLWLTHSLALDLNRAQLEAFAGRNDVRIVNHDKLVFATTMNVSRPLIQADQVENNLGFDGSGIDVAVLDSGIDFAHPALAPVMGTQQDFTGSGIGDVLGHGSHCAGTIASNDATIRGVAPGCTLHDYKIVDNLGAGSAAIAISGVQQAVADGRDVLSNSWGFSHADGGWTCPDGTCVLCTAANAAMNSGSVFVVAAGNENNDTCSTYDTHLRCPGHATLPITVAATDDSDAMASFSSIGPAADARAKPDIAAPGVQINSCRAGGKDFVDMDGTSMATPHVAGVCALMLEKNGALTPTDVKALLMRTAVDVGHTPEEMGAGRVNALDAVNAA